ncbi:MAG: hypothetical protein E5299_01475 [Burkholderia gladioli]|nr:MAG: hypothetical protein E5299_01475 [Burkholderia gladioli]
MQTSRVRNSNSFVSPEIMSVDAIAPVVIHDPGTVVREQVSKYPPSNTGDFIDPKFMILKFENRPSFPSFEEDVLISRRYCINRA